MSTKTKVGTIVKVTGGILKDKFGMVAKEFPKTDTHAQGYGVIVDQSDWPAVVPTKYNAIYVKKDRCLELSEEEQILLRLKFPNSDQFT